MRKKTILIIAGIIIIVFLIALVSYVSLNRHISQEHTPGDGKIVVVSPHPTEFIKPLLNEFETQTGIRTIVYQCGTAQAVERVRRGEGVDVLWGGSALSLGNCDDLFIPYKTSNYDSFGDKYRDVPDYMTCFTDVPSILLVNTDLLGKLKIEGYEDLLQPQLRGRIAYASPVRSSSSFEHLVNLLYAMGGGNAENGWDYAKEFASQLDGNLLDSSTLVYEGVASGKYIVGLTFEEAGITMMKKGKHVKIVYMKEGVVSTPDGIYISRTAVNPYEAGVFADFMTAYDTQKYISMDLGRRSVRSDIESSDLVSGFEKINIIEADKAVVTASKDEWTDRFMSLVLEDSDEK